MLVTLPKNLPVLLGVLRQEGLESRSSSPKPYRTAEFEGALRRALN